MDDELKKILDKITADKPDGYKADFAVAFQDQKLMAAALLSAYCHRKSDSPIVVAYAEVGPNKEDTEPVTAVEIEGKTYALTIENTRGFIRVVEEALVEYPNEEAKRQMPPLIAALQNVIDFHEQQQNRGSLH